MEATKKSRNSVRDGVLILLCYHHGLRVSEVIALRWSAINFEEGTIFINRVKGSISGVHPLAPSELRALRGLKKSTGHSPYLFLVRDHVPLSEWGARNLIVRLGRKANLDIPIHPHMLRHSCGYKLINEGKDIRLVQYWLGHKQIQNTVRYTALAHNQFEEFWK